MVYYHNLNCTPCHTHRDTHCKLPFTALTLINRIFSSSLSLMFLPHFSLHIILQTHVCSAPVSFSVSSGHKFRLKFNVHFCFRVGVSQNRPEHTSLTTKIRKSNPNHCYVSFNVTTCQNSKSRYRIIKITENLIPTFSVTMYKICW
jgi:hypothetical protein